MTDVLRSLSFPAPGKLLAAPLLGFLLTGLVGSTAIAVYLRRGAP